MATSFRSRIEEQIAATMTPNGIVIGYAILVVAIEVTLTGGAVTDEGVLQGFLRRATDVFGQWMRIALHQILGHTLPCGGIIIG